jgi:hypothetical protein
MISYPKPPSTIIDDRLFIEITIPLKICGLYADMHKDTIQHQTTIIPANVIDVTNCVFSIKLKNKVSPAALNVISCGYER